MGKRVAVVLAGCGVYDGSEIHESSAVLVHLSREGAQVRGTPAAPTPSPAPFALLCFPTPLFCQSCLSQWSFAEQTPSSPLLPWGLPNVSDWSQSEQNSEGDAVASVENSLGSALPSQLCYMRDWSSVWSVSKP